MNSFDLSAPFERHKTKVEDFLGGRDARVTRTSYAMAAFITIAAFSSLFIVKRIPVGHYMGDFLAILDGGYRIAQGQWPDVDFAVPHGPWPLVQGWIALELTRWFIPFLTYQVTQWLTVLPAAVYLAGRQSTRWRAVSLLGVAAVATLIPYVMDGENIAGFSYYAGYNRLATTLLFLTFIWIVTPTRKGFFDASVLGYLLLALLATKITGFVVAIGAASFAALLSPVKRTALLRAAVFVLVMLFLLQIVTGWPFAYVTDIRAMIELNKSGIAYALASMVLKTLPGLIAACVLMLAVLPPLDCAGLPDALRVLRLRPFTLLRSWRAPLMILVIVCGTIASESQNTGSLLLASATALLFTSFPRRRTSANFLNGARVALAVAILAPWFGSIVYRGAILARQFWELSSDPSLAKLLPGTVATRDTTKVAAQLQRLWRLPDPPRALFSASAETEPAVFVALAQTVDEAAEEVRRQSLIQPGMRVMTISSTELFARLLDAPSPVGVNLWLDPQRTFGRPPLSALHHYLRDVDAVFMRTCDVDKVYMLLNNIFRPALESAYSRHHLTSCWSVWTRKE